jgi:hypothetical protein
MSPVTDNVAANRFELIEDGHMAHADYRRERGRLFIDNVFTILISCAFKIFNHSRPISFPYIINYLLNPRFVTKHRNFNGINNKDFLIFGSLFRERYRLLGESILQYINIRTFKATN